MYLQEAKQMGLVILPPDINNSEPHFTVEGRAIRFGLSSVKHLGEKAIAEILDKRPFTSLEDAYERCDRRQLHKGVYDAMIKLGMFDWYNNDRLAVLREYYKLRGESYDGLLVWTPELGLAMERNYLGFMFQATRWKVCLPLIGMLFIPAIRLRFPVSSKGKSKSRPSAAMKWPFLH